MAPLGDTPLLTRGDLLRLGELRMTDSWLSAPPALTARAGRDPLSPARLRQHRKALVEAARRITEPH